MKQGMYKVESYDEKVKNFCELNGIEKGSEVYVEKHEDTMKCDICGKSTYWSIETDYSCPIGCECMNHIKLVKIK